MAKQATTTVVKIKVKVKKDGQGVHAKKGTSKLKTSKNYKKPYNSQGRS